MDISDNKVFALLSYIGILAVILSAITIYFHANQGLALFIGEVAYGIVRAVLLGVFKLLFGVNTNFFVNPFISIVYNAMNAITGLFSLVFLVFAIIGIINAAQGKAKELPVISKIKLLK